MIQGRELSDKTFQIDSLDGLRGLAVLIVFLSHTSLVGTFLFPFADFSGIGKSGVFLFFVLSSFLLTLPFVRKGRDSLNQIFLLNYALRRFLRVYPLYFLYLSLGLLLSLTLWKAKLEKPPFYLSFNDFIGQITLTQGKAITWSIVVEFRYYFVLPILAFAYTIILKNKLFPSMLLTALLIVICQFFWPQSQTLPNDIRLGPYLPTFFMGSLLALIYDHWQNSKFSASKGAIIVLDVFGILSLITIFCMIPSVSSLILGKKIPYNFYHDQLVLYSLLWSTVLFACVAGFGVLRKVFELPFLRYIGFISFSFYLFHVVVIGVLRKFGGDLPLKAWAMLLITIIVSHVFWMLIEKPTSKFRLGGKKISRLL